MVEAKRLLRELEVNELTGSPRDEPQLRMLYGLTPEQAGAVRSHLNYVRERWNGIYRSRTMQLLGGEPLMGAGMFFGSMAMAPFYTGSLKSWLGVIATGAVGGFITMMVPDLYYSAASNRSRRRVLRQLPEEIAP